ncbi:MAG: hypothetical protein WD768_19645 [Phycisphaeraceae bacterium]
MIDDDFDEDRIWWEQRWKERSDTIRDAFGETIPPGMVTSFSFDEPDLIVPGACAMTFAPTESRPFYLHMTQGITQPLKRGSEYSATKWEFGVYTHDNINWPKQFLYDLVTCWSEMKGRIEVGHAFPVSFFKDSHGELDCAVTDLNDFTDLVGPMRYLYLWPSLLDRVLLQTSVGDFYIMAATLATMGEVELADELTPPHLLLLLARLGLGQVSNPHRCCATDHPKFEQTWCQVKALHHDDAVRELNKVRNFTGRL